MTHSHQQFLTGGRGWEEIYRDRYAHSKRVRTTHGVNCTGCCSWLVLVKDGIIVTEMQALDYPIINEEVPPYEPRGCQRGASSSWYEYAPHRIKFPYVRKSLLKLWREEKEKLKDPVLAWQSIVEDENKAKIYKQSRGKGGFVRSTWDEVIELISSSLIYTIKKYGPDRIFGFTPIPAMSMVSFSAGSRFISLIGGVMMSFYDWYCDLPIASPQTWGEQTDVPESADWYNAGYIIDWGTNIPMTRTPDTHYYAEVRYKGTKVVAIAPDYAEYVKFADEWIPIRPGTDGALALAMAHVIAKEFHIDKKTEYFQEYLIKYTDAPFLVIINFDGERYKPGRYLRASQIDSKVKLGEWKLVVYDLLKNGLAVPNGSIGFRWSNEGKWNLMLKDSRDDREIKPALTFLGIHDALIKVSLPRFDEKKGYFEREIPVKKIKLRDGKEVFVATVFDLLLAVLGVGREGLKGYPTSYEDDEPYTPKWQEKITGIPKEVVIRLAREFARNAEETHGKSLILIGPGVNHWYHSDLAYRAIITILFLVGAVGVNGGGLAHYVGQEKVRTIEGWQIIAFARDWLPATRLQNTTSWIYFHTDQWRYDSLTMDKIAVEKTLYEHPADYNALAVRRGWLPFYPQFNVNPLNIIENKDDISKANEKISKLLSENKISFAITDIDNPVNFPRILFVWRANLLFSSGKGSEYILKHLLGTHSFVQNTEKAEGKVKEIVWRSPAPEGKLDLLITIDFRMSSTALYSDIVLPAATWYEKHDISSTDLHTFINAFNPAIDPPWETKTEWEIFSLIAKKFSEMAQKHLSNKFDVLYLPLLHDTPGEISQPLLEEDLTSLVATPYKGSISFMPGKNMGNIVVIERDYSKIYEMMITLGPNLKKDLGFLGIQINLSEEYEKLKEVKLESPKVVAEVILHLSSSTNGEISVKGFKFLEKLTGLNLSNIYEGISEIKITFSDLNASPKRVIDCPLPTESGIMKGGRTYSPFTINTEYLVPWRTLSGRQHFYLDHPIILEMGEGLVTYKPPIEENEFGENDKNALKVRYLTPHGKWQIHSTFMDNLRMLELFRGGPVIWLNEEEAKNVGIKDNDWVILKNENGITVVRAVLSHRIPKGVGIMYHAQERTVNVGEYNGFAGGSHNAVTRVNVKPTHMIGGYAQLSYSLNYYGPIGTNRDTMILVKKVSVK